MEVICTFVGHMVILEASRARKPNDRVMSPKDMIADTHIIIISNVQLNWTINN